MNAHENPMRLDGFEFVEFAAVDGGSLENIFEMLGFCLVARHRSKAASLWRQNDINFVINEEHGRVASICLDGNADMATAGSGDVLAGIVGALRARGLDGRTAAELGVWLHARAGDEAQAECRSALLAGDLVQALRLTP